MATSSSSSFHYSSSSYSPIYLLSNICNLITIRLDSTNYVPWKFQFSAILRAHSLFDFIDGSNECPDQFLRDETGVITSQINPDYQHWITQDQALMTLINATLSTTTLTHIVGYKSSRDVWTALERLYSSNTRSNVLQLKTNLQTITKGSDSVDVYVQRIKEARDKLASVSVMVDDEDLLIYTLNGLPPEFSAFRTSIRTRSQSLNLEELHALLKAEEQSIDYLAKHNQNQFVSTAMMAQSRPPFQINFGRNNQSRGRGRGRFSHRGRFNNSGYGRFNTSGSHPQSILGRAPNQQTYSSPKPLIVCQICGKNNHSAADCYHRMNYAYQGKSPSPNLTAMAAAYDPGSIDSNIWYTDSGASTHLTHDLGNLSMSTEYQGGDNISVASGHALPISHTGSGSNLREDLVPKLLQ